MSDPDPLEFVPGYISPLTERQHARLGRIAVLWGQIEHFIEQILMHVTGFTYAEMEALGIASRTISSKADYLTTVAKRVTDPAMRDALATFCELIHQTKTDRNHAFHGVWGWRGNSKSKTAYPAARKSSQPTMPLRATKLPSLEKRLCRCSRIGVDILIACRAEKQPEFANSRMTYGRFIHHDDGDRKWLEQWSKRNPMGRELLDRSAKAGQLPWLYEPFPQK